MLEGILTIIGIILVGGFISFWLFIICYGDKFFKNSDYDLCDKEHILNEIRWLRQDVDRLKEQIRKLK